jgi:hypothetical protein
VYLCVLLGVMKYFSCQPDSHNAFGSLTNGVLTYFTVDCARYRRFPRPTVSGDTTETAHATASGVSDTQKSESHVALYDASTLLTTSSKMGMQAAPHVEPLYDSHGATDTRMHIQRTLILPNAFQATQCCFSMANRTVFGTDMAFIGGANGLLALVVLQQDLLLYVRGRDPQSLRDQLQRRQKGGAVAGAAAPSRMSGTTLPHSSAGEGGASSADAAPMSHTFSAVATGSEQLIVGAPSTITWMRDKPLVLVGYSTGRVEWYRVSISPSHRQELLNPAMELPFGASVSSGAFAYQALNRDAHMSRMARVVVGGHKDGLRTEMVGSCHVPDAGALCSSDYFPVNGTVAVCGERGGVYLFHTDQLEAPLCQLNLTVPSAGFLYCHPFLPIVGVLSSVAWTGTDAARRWRMAGEDARGATRAASSVFFAGRERVADTATKGDEGGRLSHDSPLHHERRALHGSALVSNASSLSTEKAKTARHVGWYDSDARSSATTRAGGVAGVRGFFALGGEAMRMGCAITLVEYAKEFPPRQLVRSWTGDRPLSPTHRLTQVLQHWVEGTAPRYGTYYNFSWKFSFDLELVVGNLEEGALRVVRVSRLPATGAAAVNTAGATAAPSLRGRSDGASEADPVEERASDAGVDHEGNCEGFCASAAVTSTGLLHPDAYRVVQEYNVRLPLHSLVNVEYVSAATCALSILDTTVTGAVSRGGGGRDGDGKEGDDARDSVAVFQREAGRHRRYLAILSAARAAAEPRARLGFSASAAGMLCRPTHAFWAGLAVVSPPHSRRRPPARAEGSAEGRAGAAASSVAAPLDAVDLLRVLYDAAGCAEVHVPHTSVIVAGQNGVRDDASGAGPQLKENALAAAMLQPLREDYSGDGGGARRSRRHNMDTSCSSLPTWTDVASSGRLASFASASTQQPPPPQRRRRRRDRDPLAPAITVPSYAARSTQNEIATAVLIAADHRVDLHQRLRIGAGNISCVVGMNAAGEIASVPIEVRAVATWHEEGSIFVGLGPTTCAADLVSIQGIERLMRRRHAAGFGISAAANLAAASKVGGYGSADVVLLFTYIATLECVDVVASTGPVPSLMALLSGPSEHYRRVLADMAKTHTRLAPRLRAAMHDSVFHENPYRLLALQVLGWLPPSLAEQWTASPAAATAPEVPEWLHLPFEAAPTLTEMNTNTEIERAAAVEVTHARYGKAAELLLRFAHRCPNYRAVATLLMRPSEALTMVRDSDTRVCAAFCASLTPWLLVVFHCLCRGSGKRPDQPAAAPSSTPGPVKGGPLPDLSQAPLTALPCELYRQLALPLWDRVALAIVVEDDTNGALAHVLRDVLLPQCNPLQALLLHHGIHLRACPAMQEIVDSTGDFQLGACLFARVGVLTTAAALAFPFLLDGVMQRAAAASTEEGLDADGVAGSPVACMPGGHDPSASQHRLRESAKCTRGGGDVRVEDDAEGGDSVCERSSNDNAHNGSNATSSPYAYLYGGVSQQSRGRASPHVGPAGSNSTFDPGVSHTALLVRNSALPPPPLPLSPVPGIDAGSRVHTSSPHARLASSSLPPPSLPRRQGQLQQWRKGDKNGNNANLRGIVGSTVAATTTSGGTTRHRQHDDRGGNDVVDINHNRGGNDDSDCFSAAGDGEAIDEPWVWWAAAYRSFLDDEQAFVRRTTFDVECQQLRSRALSIHEGLSAGPSRGPAANSGEGSRRDPICSDAVACSHGVPRYRAPALQPDSEVFALLPEALVDFVGGAKGFPPRGHGGSTGFSPADLAIGGHAAFGTAAITTAECVCGERHEGTQLIRSLLNLCSMTTTRCSVCLEPVRLGSCHVSSAFAWCTSCRHGGHAHHLQEWFRSHRRCPMNGCDCHCDEDSSLF